jgi:murein DD-endopeptidase MepM/ murein hydrolase activator NlpD
LLKRLLQKRTFTLLIVPDSGAGIRTVRVTFSRLRSVVIGGATLPALGLLLILALLPVAGRSLGDPMGKSRQYAMLKERVKSLDSDLDRLKRRQAESTALESRLRVLAGLEPIDPEVSQMGVGGPDFAAQDPLAQLDSEVAGEVSRVSHTADQLLRQAEFQRYSYLEIVESLEKKREEWARVPSIAPVASGEVSSGFGRRLDPFTEQNSFHQGVDMSAERGESIVATAGGRVVFAGRNHGYGLSVSIDHGNGLETMYAHVSEVKVRRGEQVKRGQEIAKVGNTGRSTGSHVHYEVRLNGRAVNPDTYILPLDVVVD